MYDIDSLQHIETPTWAHTQNVWVSADGLRIPKAPSRARKRWDQAFAAVVQSVWPNIVYEPFVVNVSDLEPRNPPYNEARKALYLAMARAKNQLPTIVVARLGARWFVVDGNHRLAAAKLTGLASLCAVELPGRQKR